MPSDSPVRLPGKNILLALHVYDERLHRGVLRFSIEHNWHVRLVGPGSWKHHRNFRPDGVISMMSPEPGIRPASKAQSAQGGFYPDDDADEMSRHVAALGIPQVELGLFRPEVPAVRIVPDNAAAGRLAARHLIACEGRRFLHVTNGRSPQDIERRNGFLGELREAGHDAAVLYAGEEGVLDDGTMLAALKKYPLPLSVFCSFDIWAAFVLSACRLGGLRVPEDVAILGCYNHELVSAFETPPLSSIDMNIESRGYLAARALMRLMRGELRNGEMIRTSVGKVIERAGTNRKAALPRELAAALHHIGANLTGALDVPSIARAVGASRSILQKQCHRAMGCGIGEAVAGARVEKARELLAATTLTASAIAFEIGYTSPFQFYRVFKKRTGMTAGEYRKSVAPEAGPARRNTA